MDNQEELISKTDRPDILGIIARKKLGLEPHWTCSGWKRMEPDGLIVRVREEYVISKGKRKGVTSWRGEQKEVIATYAEIDRAEMEWEQESGKCHQCGGDGQENCGWKAEEGALFRTCQRCCGSGKAQGL